MHPEPANAEIRAALDRILSSPAFAAKERQAGLWRQPVAGGPEELVTAELPGRMWANWRVVKDGADFVTFEWDKPYSAKRWFCDSASRAVRLAARTTGIAAPLNSGLTVTPDASIYFAEGLSW